MSDHDAVNTAEILALYAEALPGWCVESLCGALDAARAERDDYKTMHGVDRATNAEARIAAALAEHPEASDKDGSWCPTCQLAYPCATRTALTEGTHHLPPDASCAGSATSFGAPE